MSSKNRNNKNALAAIVGTTTELIARGITVNGVLLGQPEISVLHRLGLATKVGSISPKDENGKVTRGKPSSVLSFTPSMNITFAANAEVVAATPAIVAPQTEPETPAVTAENETPEVSAELAAGSEPITANEETLPEALPQTEPETPAVTVEA